MIQTVKTHVNNTIQENKQKRLAKFYKNSKNKPNNIDVPKPSVTRVYGETSPMPIKPKPIINVPTIHLDVMEKPKPDNTNNNFELFYISPENITVKFDFLQNIKQEKNTDVVEDLPNIEPTNNITKHFDFVKNIEESISNNTSDILPNTGNRSNIAINMNMQNPQLIPSINNDATDFGILPNTGNRINMDIIQNIKPIMDIQDSSNNTTNFGILPNTGNRINMDIIQNIKPIIDIQDSRNNTTNFGFKHKQVVIIITLHVLNSIFYNFHLFKYFENCIIAILDDNNSYFDKLILPVYNVYSPKIIKYKKDINIFKQYQKNSHFILYTPQYTVEPTHINYIIKYCSYSIYQTEQINTKQRFNLYINNTYLDLFKSASIIYDYSITNIDNYPKNIINIVWLPFYINSFTNELIHKDIDILFCGTINKRRNNIIETLQHCFPSFNIHVVKDIFGINLTELIKRTKICLNLHYYNETTLEIARIHEFLPYNVHIISETTNESLINEIYESSISFIPVITEGSTCDALITAIKNMIHIPVPNNVLNFRKQIINVIHKLYDDMFIYTKYMFKLSTRKRNTDFLSYFENITKTSMLVSTVNTKLITHCKCKDNDTFLDDEYITYSKQYNFNYSYATLPLSQLNIPDKFVLIVDFPNGGGGTTFFLDTIISKYCKNQTFVIVRKMNSHVRFFINNSFIIDTLYTDNTAYKFILSKINSIVKIFFNHTLGHSSSFINLLHNLPKHKTYITHDFYCLTDNCHPYVHNIINFMDFKPDLSMYDCIITQNIENIKFLQHGLTNKSNIIVSPLPDYKYSDNLIETSNNKIIVGIIGAISKIKGLDILHQIIKTFQNTQIEIIVFGITNIPNFKSYYPYKNISELNNLLIKHKPNILIETSLWPESYCYTLTLAMITQLPILYLYKPFDSVIKNRLATYKNAYEYKNINEFKLLVYSKKQDFFYTIKTTVYYPSFWDSYFSTSNFQLSNTKEVKIQSLIKNNVVKKFCIYFPQFHKLKENDINFYNDYTDIKNLILIQNNNQTNDTSFFKDLPDITYLNIESANDYNLLNDNIIDKQVQIINNYNFDGFATYYYWFTINTITASNLIMFEPIIKLLNRKTIFFIWANENWSDNPAFSQNNENIIINDYNDIEKHCDMLVSYFKHKNYFKICNKPVFYIHHPWFIPADKINTFYNYLNNLCIQSGFDGIFLKINSMNFNSDYISKHKMKLYDFHPNYKKSTSNILINKPDCFQYLDYADYLSKLSFISNTQTLFFDFDNSARLFKPNKLNKRTKCINNTTTEHRLFCNKLFTFFHTTKFNDKDPFILLINAFNEWGEKMHIEPSLNKGTYYIDLINEYF